MAIGSGPTQSSAASPNPSLAAIQQKHCVVVDFLRKMPKNQQIPGEQLTQARLAAIRMIASGAKLRLQHAFLLHVFTAGTELLSFINTALRAGELTADLASFCSTLHDALQQLPMVEQDTTVYRLVPGDFEPETYSEGRTLHWSGFTVGFSNRLALLSDDGAEKHYKSTLLRMKARTGRSLADFSSTLSYGEVVFTPRTHFKVTGQVAEDAKLIVDLEEVTLPED